MKGKSIILLHVLLILLFSCKKEEDNTNPSIQINSPFENQSFKALDAVSVKGQVTDNKGIEQIIISLTDGKGGRKAPSLTLFPKGEKSFILDHDFVINNTKLETGTYYLTVEALDKENRSASFVQISVLEIERKKTGSLVIAASGSLTQVYQVDDDLNFQLHSQFNGDFTASSINSEDQQLYTIGRYTGDLICTDISSKTVSWRRESREASGLPYFEGFIFKDQVVYYSLFEGDIRGVNSSGAEVFSGKALIGNIAKKLLKHEDLIVTEEKSLTSPDRKLVVYFEVSGQRKQELLLTDSIISFFSLDANKLLLFMKQGNDQVIKKYNIDGNFLEFDSKTLAADRITAVTKVDALNYLYAQGSSIYNFNATNFESRLVVGNEVDAIAYDEINRQIWAAKESQLSIYQYDTGELMRSITSPQALDAIHILYNK